MNTEEFIKGFQELRLRSPKLSVTGYQTYNSPYGNAIYTSKNCYLCFDMDGCDGVMYCGTTTRSRTSGDCEDLWDSELCYECVEVYNSYNCDYSQFLRQCSDCSYSYDLLNCQNCFGCVGLRRTQFAIFNEHIAAEDYPRKLAEAKKMPLTEIMARVEKLRLAYPHVAMRQYQTENCFGDNIQNSKNCFYGFNAKNVFDGAYLYDLYTVYGDRNEDTYDSYFNVDLHSCYECIEVGDGWNCSFCHIGEHIRECDFTSLCFNSKNLFGCTAVNRKEYLILNTPYQKEEWHKVTSALRDSLKAAGKYNWGIYGV